MFSKYSYYLIAALVSVIIACIASAIETDIYVPSFPDMIEAFGSSESEIQQILSLNFLGIFFSGLICGPLADRLGNRKVLLWGVGLFVLSSLVCSFASSFNMMLIARFFQGLGAGAINTVAFSLIFSLFDSKHSIQLTALLSSVCTIMIAVAPLAGSFINVWFGWRASFLLIFLLAITSWMGMFIFIPKKEIPNAEDHPRVLEILNDFKSLLLNRNFLLKTYVRVAMFSCLFIYTANVSLLFIEHLSMSEQAFGFFQASTMGCFCLFSLMSAYLIELFGRDKVKNYGITLYLLGGLILILVSVWFPITPALIALSIGIIGAGIGLSNAVFFGEVIEDQPKRGVAIALTQSLAYLPLWGYIEISRRLFNGTIGSITLLIIAIMISVVASIFVVDRRVQSC